MRTTMTTAMTTTAAYGLRSLTVHVDRHGSSNLHVFVRPESGYWHLPNQLTC
jgi:hypothetical protein